MTDKNGKTIAVGARVVVLKYGDMRMGTVVKTRRTEENVQYQGGGKREWKSELAYVNLDPVSPEPVAGSGRYTWRAYERKNAWMGQSTNMLVLQEAA